VKNIAASVRARLANHAEAHGQDFGHTLEEYALGRFLWRISQSRYSGRFVLKGARMFAVWADSPHRPTRDADLLSFGECKVSVLHTLFTELCAPPPDPPDGLTWEVMTIEPIRAETAYGGMRINLMARLAKARISVQVDVGFGDAVTPEPVMIEWQGMLDFPPVPFLGYPPETVVAEKLEAAVLLGNANSRMKDFYDLYWLSYHMQFDENLLTNAIENTFSRRGSEIPHELPAALTDAFAGRSDKLIQWKAFLRKSKLEPLELGAVITRLREFLVPVLLRGHVNSSGTMQWEPAAGWRENKER
jgi:hypothetical protein